ncbi:MAG: hypothetical protein H6744_19095 [Deltaproteobacteria bacterium]|nr:hypothetical protein [Deltaproteobacteria bacterium]
MGRTALALLLLPWLGGAASATPPPASATPPPASATPPPAGATHPLAARMKVGCAWLDSADAAEAGKDSVLGELLDALRGECRANLAASQAPGWHPDEAQATLVEELEMLRAGLGEPGPGSEAGGSAPPAPAAKPPRTPRAPDAAPVGRDPAAPATGVWQMPPEKRIDAYVKRRLRLEQDGRALTGTLTEETWFRAPPSWVETSCGGHPVFRMVTEARVSGKVSGDSVTFRRERPSLVSCTCGARCIPEKRRRGFSFTLAENDEVLRDGDTLYVREGASLGRAARSAGAGDGGSGDAGAARKVDLAGEWQSDTYARGGASVVSELALTIDGDSVSGTLTERVTQPLPLESWRDRFCDGATRFEYVESFEVDGTRSGGDLALRFKGGQVRLCTCPSKCLTPRHRGMSLSLSPAGTALEGSGLVFRRP